MKIAINECYGGFSLSPLAVKELAKMRNKECYFFEMELFTEKYKSISIEQAEKSKCWFAYSVPNPQDYKLTERGLDGSYTDANKRSEEISLNNRPCNRDDKDLIFIIENLGEKANGIFAKIKIVEIPDDIEYTIEEYDGREWIAEKHRTWE